MILGGVFFIYNTLHVHSCLVVFFVFCFILINYNGVCSVQYNNLCTLNKTYHYIHNCLMTSFHRCVGKREVWFLSIYQNNKYHEICLPTVQIYMFCIFRSVKNIAYICLHSFNTEISSILRHR